MTRAPLGGHRDGHLLPSGEAEKRKPRIPHDSPGSPNLFSPGDGFITQGLLNILGQATSASLARDRRDGCLKMRLKLGT